MTAIDAAIALGVSRRTVYRWVASGRLSWPIVLDPLALPTPRRRGPQRSPWSVRYWSGRHTFRSEGEDWMTIHEGQTNDHGEVLLLDKWAEEGGKRVRVWRLEHGDIRIEFVDAGMSGEPAYASLRLARYRAEDLAKALARPA